MLVKCIWNIRKVFFAVFILTNSLLSAKTFYVAPNGSNGSNGLYPEFISGSNGPWADWTNVLTSAIAGDTVYFRGGIYNLSARINFSNSGTSVNYIHYFNYPGEKPIFDFITYPPADFMTALWVRGVSYLKFRGFEIRNLLQKQGLNDAGTGYGGVSNAIYVARGTNIYFDNITVRNIGTVGFSISSEYVFLTNCDAIRCVDEYTSGIPYGTAPFPYGAGDGYQISSAGPVYVTGCRAMYCSDDGWDNYWNNGQVFYESCWAVCNGKDTTGVSYPEGPGNGFKLGKNVDTPTGLLQRSVVKCISVNNDGAGFTENNEGTNWMWVQLYNNLSYGNATGYTRFGSSRTPLYESIYRNNIEYNNTKALYWVETALDEDYNSWNDGMPTITDDDFISLDINQLLAARHADGSLPEITFGRLVSSSDLIDAGVDVGLPFSGSAPDLGWFEASGTSSVPTYMFSVIEDVTPSLLELNYNIALINIIPPATAFTVKVNSFDRAINSVSISGTKVILSLQSPIAHSDIVTVAYTKPTSNPLQTATGGQAASFSPQNVTNNVGAINPVYVSSVIENATPSRLEMTYNLALANIIPAVSAFIVKVNTVARTVSSVAVSGTKVLLTLASPVISGDAVTVAYTKPASNPLQTAAGGQAVSITAQNVTNNVSAVVNQPPVVNISSPTKSTSFITPATITIDANASDPDGSVTKVEFYNGTSKLGEITTIPYSYTWKEVPAGTYSITAAATDNKGLRTVSTAVTVVVEKSATVVNQLPSVSIKIPNDKQPKKHDNVVIIAEASDPDGTISKVELKSGNITIAEMTTAPYAYTLQNVDTGTYVITAIATDNLGAVNISDALELRIYDSPYPDPDLISIYPNPNNGVFKIAILSELPAQERSLSIINLAGSTVYQDNLATEENSKEIGLPDLQPGTYVLMLTTGNSIMAAKKFVKR